MLMGMLIHQGNTGYHYTWYQSHQGTPPHLQQYMHLLATTVCNRMTSLLHNLQGGRQWLKDMLIHQGNTGHQHMMLQNHQGIEHHHVLYIGLAPTPTERPSGAARQAEVLLRQCSDRSGCKILQGKRIWHRHIQHSATSNNQTPRKSHQYGFRTARLKQIGLKHSGLKHSGLKHSGLKHFGLMHFGLMHFGLMHFGL